MYPNLEAEMARTKMTRGALALKLGITATTLSLKLNGKSPLSLDESKSIKEIIGTDAPLDYLFATAEQEVG